MNRFVAVFSIGFCAAVAFAAPKSAAEYYSDAAFQYIESRLPSAEITCKEGLSYYPSDSKLQMLLDRIQEAKDKQKQQNQNQNNKDKNQNQDKNQNGKDKQNQDKNKGNQNQDQNKDKDQNQNQNKNNGQNRDQNNGQQGRSSSSGMSSQSNGGEPQLPPGSLSHEDAAQLLKDFDKENGERKPWRPVQGTAVPEKDW